MNNNEEEKKDEIEFELEVDQEILDLIFKLYDGTFRDLVNR